MSVKLQNFGYDEMNLDIYKRNVPSQQIDRYFSPRPVNTKYRELPILDPKLDSNNFNFYQTYNNKEVFFPSNDKPHYSAFAGNIDSESVLRNQFFALQKGDQHLYVPTSNSDLYHHNPSYMTHNGNLNNLMVFNEEDFNDFNPNISNNIGRNIFHNNTRVQLKEL